MWLDDSPAPLTSQTQLSAAKVSVQGNRPALGALMSAVYLEPDAEYNGAATVHVSVVDARELRDDAQVHVWITAVNNPPSVEVVGKQETMTWMPADVLAGYIGEAQKLSAAAEYLGELDVAASTESIAVYNSTAYDGPVCVADDGTLLQGTQEIETVAGLR